MTSKLGFKSYAGFTLLELMIALVVMAILVSIVIPSATSYINKARRTEGRALILEMASKQEIFYSSRLPNSYSNSLVGLGYAADPQETESGNYSVSVLAAPVGCDADPATPAPVCTSYVLTATRIDKQTNDSCGNFTINNFGVKNTVGGTTPVDHCW